MVRWNQAKGESPERRRPPIFRSISSQVRNSTNAAPASGSIEATRHDTGVAMAPQSPPIVLTPPAENGGYQSPDQNNRPPLLSYTSTPWIAQHTELPVRQPGMIPDPAELTDDSPLFLLVDDNDINLRILSSFMKRLDLRGGTLVS
jgi:hypothetical protein